MTLLLVDDAISYRMRLRSYLNAGLPFVHIAGETGCQEEAFALALAAQPDVVMLDIQLGGSGGLQLLRRLKALSRPPIAIVLTDLVSREYHTACFEGGADFFFDKAFGLDVLEGVLRDLQRLFDEDQSFPCER